MKKILALFLVAVMAISLASCGGDGGADTTAPQDITDAPETTLAPDTTEAPDTTVAEAKKFDLILNCLPEAGGTAEGSGEFEKGDEVTIKATANEGYEFLGWYVGDNLYSDAAETKITIRGKTTYTAKFKDLSAPESPEAAITAALDKSVLYTYAANTSYKGFHAYADSEYLYLAIDRNGTNPGATTIIISINGSQKLDKDCFHLWIGADGTYTFSISEDGVKFGKPVIENGKGDVGGFYCFHDTSKSGTTGQFRASARIPFSYLGVTSAPATIGVYEVESSWALERTPSAWQPCKLQQDGTYIKDTSITPSTDTTPAAPAVDGVALKEIKDNIAKAKKFEYTATTSYQGFWVYSTNEYIYVALQRKGTSAGSISMKFGLNTPTALNENCIQVYATASGSYNIVTAKSGTKFDDNIISGGVGEQDGFYCVIDSSTIATDGYYTAYAKLPLAKLGLSEAPATISVYDVEGSWSYENTPSEWVPTTRAADGSYSK